MTCPTEICETEFLEFPTEPTWMRTSHCAAGDRRRGRLPAREAGELQHSIALIARFFCCSMLFPDIKLPTNCMRVRMRGMGVPERNF